MNTDFILARAKQIALAQGRLAKSPAELATNGKLDLCAASCVGKAMLELSDDRELLSHFEERLFREDKFIFLPYIFEKHGLPSDAARRLLSENDQSGEEERLPWFSSLTSI